MGRSALYRVPYGLSGFRKPFAPNAAKPYRRPPKPFALSSKGIRQAKAAPRRLSLIIGRALPEKQSPQPPVRALRKMEVDKP